MLPLFRRFSVLLVVLALLGCNREKVRNVLDEQSREVTEGLKEARQPAPVKSYNPLTVSDKVWTGNTSIHMRRGLPLPARFEASRGVVLIANQPMDISEIASLVSTQTGIPVRLSSSASASASVSSPAAPAAAPVFSAAGSNNGAGNTSSGNGDGITLAYEGSLSGLLDLVAAHFGLSWRYDGASVNFTRYETRVFMIESLPGTQSIKDGMKEDSGSGGGGTSGGASSTSALQQSSEMNVEFKVWEELGQTINAILGGVGSVVLAPSSGAVTVTTTPEVMQAVAQYIEQENKRLSKQIAINVEVYKVDLQEGSDFSLSFKQAIANMLGAKFTMNGTQGPALVQGSPLSSTATSLDSTATVTGFGAQAGSLMVSIINGNLVPTFMALSALGDTSRVAQFPLTTLNNRPVSRRIGRDRSYVQSMANTTSTTTTGTTSVTITPGTIREGFSLQLTPRLLDDGRIMLQYSMSLVDIVNLTTFGSGTNMVQLPETASRVFVQQSMLRSGSTLVIGGYDDEQNAQNAQGVGSPFNFLLGGGNSSQQSHSMLFIAITPRVLETQPAEQP